VPNPHKKLYIWTANNIPNIPMSSLEDDAKFDVCYLGSPKNG